MAEPPRFRVVYTDVTDLDPGPGMRLLEEAGAEVAVVPEGAPDDELRGYLAEADAVICGYRQLSRDSLEHAPDLRIIATLSVGTDMVDLAAAQELGIRVCNVPPVASEEVATHALALLLALERRIPMAASEVSAGRWDPIKFGAPRRLSNLTLGILGFGRIGRRFASLAGPLFSRTLVFDPITQDAEGLPVHFTELSEVIQGSDVLSLHMPLTPETHFLLDAAAFARMRPGATIINVSRGALIDPAALLAALRSGKVLGAGLDVTYPEPPDPNDPLLHERGVLVTPHVAFASEHTLSEYALAPAREIINLWHGQPSISPVRN